MSFVCLPYPETWFIVASFSSGFGVKAMFIGRAGRMISGLYAKTR